MFYTVYKTINLINNKFYIGVHKTNNPLDSYLGSGTILRKAIQKYGKQNFIKEILFTYSTSEDMYKKEHEILTENFLMTNKHICYNLRVGGTGGWNKLFGDKILNLQQDSTYKQKQLNTMIKKYGVRAMSQLPSHRIKMEQGCIEKYGVKSTFLLPGMRTKIQNTILTKYGVINPSQNEEINNKRKTTFKEIKHQQGSTNSNYGTMWVYKDVNVRILKSEYNLFVEKGFSKGRRMNLPSTKKKDLL